MKKLFTLVLLICIAPGFAQTKLYVHPDADSYVARTKSLAILPLDVQVKLRPKELKDFTPEQIVDMNHNEAKDIQKAMYSWFLTRKKRGSLKIENIQNPTVTNSILKKNNIDIFDYSEYTPEELGKILNVDVVVQGSFETSKPMSGAAGAALLLVGGFAGATSNATMNMDFFDTRDNELVVNYFKNIKGGLGTTSDDLINILMRKASRRIPYTGM